MSKKKSPEQEPQQAQPTPPKTTTPRTRYTLDQWLTIVAALIFLAGGVFMLVNVFGGYTWAFIVGIVLAVVASCIMVFSMLWGRKKSATSTHPTQPNNSD